MRTFEAMRKFINENKNIFKRLTTVEYEMIECKDKIDDKEYLDKTLEKYVIIKKVVI